MDTSTEINFYTTLFDKWDNKLAALKLLIIDYFYFRLNCVYDVTGKDRGSPAWQIVLVDTDKRDDFLEKLESGIVDAQDYGTVLYSGWGQQVPEEFQESTKDIANWLPHTFHIIVEVIGKHEYWYYVLCDTNTHKFSQSKPILPQIKICAKLLHTGWGQEVPEAIVDIFLKSIIKNDFIENWNNKCDESLYSAARNDDVTYMMMLLISSGRNASNISDSNKWYLLHHAAYGGCLEVLKFLIEKNADVTKRDAVCGIMPIHIAAREGHTKALKFLGQNGYVDDECDYNGWRLPHYACWSGNLKLVQFLIKRGIDMNSPELFHGKKPFHIAAREGHTELVKFFLNAGMDIEEKDAEDRTPLYYSVWMGHFKTFNFLIDKGANIHCKNVYMQSIMHLASDKNFLKILEVLVRKGCNKEDKNIYGYTPLHEAANNDALQCVKHLCKEGANISALTNEGDTPLDLAKKKNFTAVIEFLEAEQTRRAENLAVGLQRVVEIVARIFF